MAKVTWTEPALAQFEAIVDHIALDKPGAARAVVARTLAVLEHLGQFVRLGRPIPEFSYPDHFQAWIKPCWFYFRIIGDTVAILHVRRAERPLMLEYLLNEDDIREGGAFRPKSRDGVRRPGAIYARSQSLGSFC